MKASAAKRIVDKLDQAAQRKADEQAAETLSETECNAEIRRLLRGQPVKPSRA